MRKKMSLFQSSYVRNAITTEFERLTTGLIKYEELSQLADEYDAKSQLLLTERYHDGHRLEVLPVVKKVGNEVETSTREQDAVESCYRLDKTLDIVDQKTDYYQSILNFLSQNNNIDYVRIYESKKLKALFCYDEILDNKNREEGISTLPDDKKMPAIIMMTFEDNNIRPYDTLDTLLSEELDSGNCDVRAYIQEFGAEKLRTKIENGLYAKDIEEDGSSFDKINKFLQKVFTSNAETFNNRYNKRGLEVPVYDDAVSVIKEANKNRPAYNQVFINDNGKDDNGMRRVIVSNILEIPKSFLVLNYTDMGIQDVFYYNKRGEIQRIYDNATYYRGLRVIPNDENYQKLINDPIIRDLFDLEGLEISKEKTVIEAHQEVFSVDDIGSVIPENEDFIFELEDADSIEILISKMQQKANYCQGRLGNYIVGYIPVINAITLKTDDVTLFLNYDNNMQPVSLYEKNNGAEKISYTDRIMTGDCISRPKTFTKYADDLRAIGFLQKTGYEQRKE